MDIPGLGTKCGTWLFSCCCAWQCHINLKSGIKHLFDIACIEYFVIDCCDTRPGTCVHSKHNPPPPSGKWRWLFYQPSRSGEQAPVWGRHTQTQAVQHPALCEACEVFTSGRRAVKFHLKQEWNGEILGLNQHIMKFGIQVLDTTCWKLQVLALILSGFTSENVYKRSLPAPLSLQPQQLDPRRRGTGHTHAPRKQLWPRWSASVSHLQKPSFSWKHLIISPIFTSTSEGRWKLPNPFLPNKKYSYHWLPSAKKRRIRHLFP